MSFKLQCDKFVVDCEIPSQTTILETIEKVNSKYKNHTLPSWLLNYDREEWRKSIIEMKNFVKRDSSPGVPFHMRGSTNGKIFDDMQSDFEDAVLDRIEARLYYGLKIGEMSRTQMIELNICDPVRVFVKDEPHKVSKLQQGRVRLIMSVSVADKMIEMLLSRHLHKLEIQNWMEIPSKPGIGFTRAANQEVYNDVMAKGDMAYADISGWDWSCKPWLMQVCAEGKIHLCTNASDVWSLLVRLEPLIESRSIYQFSDGVMVSPNFAGIVNSGKYKTSRDNSWMRVFLATIVGAEHVLAAGDDTVESWVDGAADEYAKYGWALKDYKKVVEGFEFCSRWYQDNGSYPLNIDKLLMNLLHTKPKDWLEYDMYRLQFVDQLEDHPEFPVVMELLDSIGFLPEQAGAQ